MHEKLKIHVQTLKFDAWTVKFDVFKFFFSPQRSTLRHAMIFSVPSSPCSIFLATEFIHEIIK